MAETTDLSATELKLELDGNSVDWLLQKLVSVVNSGSIELGITLYMQGLIVSGLLVSGKKYFKILGEDFYKAYPGSEEAKANLRAAFESNGEIYDHEDGEEAPAPHFIHLANARCFSHSGSPIPSNEGVLWRGKINAVSGFTVGQLG